MGITTASVALAIAGMHIVLCDSRQDFERELSPLLP
jgi:hypothetical protein